MPKNIIICFDGTGNDFSDYLTNVAKIAGMAKYSEKQRVFYSLGVGTNHWFRQSLGNMFINLFGKMFGYGMIDNLIAAYTFLMENYEQGDLIFGFGFSRGAEEIREFFSLLAEIGLLYKGNEHLIPYVARLYIKKKDKESLEAIKNSLCQECSPYFLGVWDTVDSRGKLYKKLYPIDANIHKDLKYAYQALAIDEKRFMFQPVPFNWPPNVTANTTMEQVWFPGVHSDIGGGNPNQGLSDISLLWMLSKAVPCGLVLEDGWSNGIKPNIFTPICESYKGLWKIWSPFHRPIPDGATLHISVIRKMKYAKDYYPSNLPRNYRISDWDKLAEVHRRTIL